MHQVTLLDLFPTLLELGGQTLANPPSSPFFGLSLAPLLFGEIPPSESEPPAFGESGHCFFPWLNDRLLIKPDVKSQSQTEKQGDVPDELENLGISLRGRLRMIRQGGWKLIRTPGPGGADRLELYNLVADPGETENLALVNPELLQEMLAELERWTASDKALDRLTAEGMSEATVNRLRALGYLP